MNVQKFIPHLAVVLILIGVLNFSAFMACCIHIGGSAGNGEMREGKFFVSEHGKEQEVSARTFKLNQIHGRSLWATHPLALLGVLILATTTSKRS